MSAQETRGRPFDTIHEKLYKDQFEILLKKMKSSTNLAGNQLSGLL